MWRAKQYSLGPSVGERKGKKNAAITTTVSVMNASKGETLGKEGIIGVAFQQSSEWSQPSLDKQTARSPMRHEVAVSATLA